jgi:vacuolar-type H+-ATPase subunit E/Vma4
MKVRDLDVEEFKALIQEAVEEKLEEILGDPDQGLELQEKVKERLEHSLAAMAQGKRGIPVEEVAKEVGLEW